MWSMTVTVETIDAERTCGYSDCSQPLNYHGIGRPPEYCTDRRWPADDPAGKTCKQMAAQERSAQRAVGLDLLLASYHASAATVVPVAETLLERLTHLLTKTANLGEGALAAVATAEAAAANAIERATTADADAVRARRAETAAIAARDHAISDATNATNAAREARAAADAQVKTALADVADAQHARGIAEANASAAARAAAEADDRRAVALTEVQVVTGALQEAREHNAMALRTIDELTQRADLADAATAHVRELLHTVTAARAADETRVNQLIEENRQAQSRIRDLEQINRQLRDEAAVARADADAAATKGAVANELLDRAEAETRTLQDRYDRLLSRLLDATEDTSPAHTSA